MKTAIVLGTRPEIIKMSPIINECERLNLDFFILHTGQHYSFDMDKLFFDQLELPGCKYNLNIGSGNHGDQTGRMLKGIEEIIIKETPDMVLVEGDTNTVLAGALAASKLGIRVGHIEAGLRSHDRTMPEEINRVLTDHISSYLFAPTYLAKSNLLNEGIAESNISITGNTIVDAVIKNRELARKNPYIYNKLDLIPGQFVLLSLHRQENVDVKEKINSIILSLELIYKNLSIPIIFPIHPRTQKRINEFGLSFPSGVRIISPLNFLDFLNLESSAKIVLTDSGGVQEEACILRVPCVTLRENTERPETLEVGSNMLAGTNSKKIMESVSIMINKRTNWDNPFGDGSASKRIISTIYR